MSLISNNIKYLRKLNGLTQEQFAKRIGIKRSLLGAYEEGRANPNWNALTAIAKAFNTTIDTLLKQDMQKIRSTPDLSIPLINNGPVQRASNIPTIPPPIFREPDQFPGSENSAATGPEPRPLSSVLENFYPGHERSGHERPNRDTSFLDELTAGERSLSTPPRPPEIRSPTAPQPASMSAPRPTVLVQAAPQRLTPRPVIRRSEAGPVPATSSRQAEPTPVFNNVYTNGTTSPRSMPTEGTTTGTERGPAMAYVQQFQFGEYSQRFQQPDYLSRLPTVRLPMAATGHYRVFEADADFAYPGALLVGQYVRNWFDIADGRLYMLVTNAGVVCRRVFNQVKTKGTLLLTADRTTTPSSEVALNDVLEVWEVRAFFSQQLPEASTTTDRATVSRIRQLAEELRFEAERLR